MGTRYYEKEAGWYGAEFAARRQQYSDLNIDPHARTRAGSAGRRQEDWQDILAHGERSDTDWDKTFRENAKQMRQNYSPRGDWAKRKDMDKTTQMLYDATLGYQRGTTGLVGGGGGYNRPSKPEGYDTYQTGGFTESQRPASGMGSRGKTETFYTKPGQGRDANDISFSGEQVASFNRYDVQSASAVQSANKNRDVAAAKWMAEYNKNLNIHERIALSEKRVKHRERFADMQIQREQMQSRRTRDVLKKGASGLSVNFGAGAGTGLAI